jgi:hypothetical protein
VQRIEGVLRVVDYHQFYVVTEGESAYPEFPATRSIHDVIAPTSGHGFCVMTGIAMGSINLAIEVLDLPPETIDDTRDWEGVTDISFSAESSVARVQALMHPTPAPFSAFTLPRAPGWYRVRAHAQGRSLNFDSVVRENPREYHLLQMWPAGTPEGPIDHRIDNQWEHQHLKQVVIESALP